jgi:Tfp pilus assembly protein PilF
MGLGSGRRRFHSVSNFGELAPRRARAWFGLMSSGIETVEEAWRRLARGDFRGAAELSDVLLSRAPNDVSALSCNAMSRWQLGGDIERAISDLGRAVTLAPEIASIRHNLATILASKGDLDGARDNFLKAIALKPDDAEAFYGLSQNYKFKKETDVLRQMLTHYSSGRLTPASQEFVCFGLAKAYNDLGRPDRAMHFCLEANRLAQRPYDVETPRAQLDELRRLVLGEGLQGIADSGNQSAAPVFIVGMPRSGTTLVETILARHPQVHAGGEMLHMFNVEQALMTWMRNNKGYVGGPYQMLRGVPTAFLQKNAEAVLKLVSASAARPFSVFTDKLPENTQRLGLISLLFPKARIIHVRRHALDCCISNLFQRFALGHGFAFRQDLLGERYRQVAETMGLWRRMLELPILEVSYEALVSDPEPQIRRLVDFSGLAWEDACLTPELASRRVMTASQWQVKQPINRQSVDRWREYEEWIQPLIAALGGIDWIEAEARSKMAVG